MLTQQQYNALMYIYQKQTETGVTPSFDEMKDALGLKSKSGIARLIQSLEERGFIKRLQNKARALEVIKLPGERTELINQTKQLIKDIQKTPTIGSGIQSGANSVDLPLYGKIAAGTPIEALRNEEDTVSVPQNMVGNGEHYALTIEGESMIEAGILDGDTVLVRKTQNAENGQIVVALVDGVEVTLKYLRKKGNTIALEPANKNYETRIFSADRVQIQGILVGLMRKY